MPQGADALSPCHKHLIQSSFSNNSNWGFDWTGYACTPITDANINSAADEWVANEAAAISKYGPIGTWDTEDVTSFAATFFLVRLASKLSRPLAKGAVCAEYFL